MTSAYIGRFAPSPSGALHFGSLLAALASYLDARAHSGRWLLRIEDLDPAREPPGAAQQIMETLTDFGFSWDGPVLYQSQRIDEYHRILDELNSRQLIYPCDCSRQRIRELNSIYDNHCRHRQDVSTPHSLRLQLPPTTVGFDDRIQGHYEQNLVRDCGDVVLLRRDGLIAYQLAVVVDDAMQGITDVVRGYDLIDSTPRQIALQQILRLPTPRYAHIPVASNQQGLKLSKQNFAPALNARQASQYLRAALKFLGQDVHTLPQHEKPAAVLEWAIERWDIQRVPKLANIPVRDHPGQAF